MIEDAPPRTDLSLDVNGSTRSSRRHPHEPARRAARAEYHVVVNAVADATGVRVRDLPLRVESLLPYLPA